jgi:hypothetical protein
MTTSTSSVPTATSPAASSPTIIAGAAVPPERTIAAIPPTTAAPIRTPMRTFPTVPWEVVTSPETPAADSLFTSLSVSWRSVLVNSESDVNASRRYRTQEQPSGLNFCRIEGRFFSCREDAGGAGCQSGATTRTASQKVKISNSKKRLSSRLKNKPTSRAISAHHVFSLGDGSTRSDDRSSDPTSDPYR